MRKQTILIKQIEMFIPAIRQTSFHEKKKKYKQKNHPHWPIANSNEMNENPEFV